MIESFGGRVTSSVSGRTDFVVVGKSPGAVKVGAARDRGIPTPDIRSIKLTLESSGGSAGAALEDAPAAKITAFSTGYRGNGLGALMDVDPHGGGGAMVVKKPTKKPAKKPAAKRPKAAAAAEDDDYDAPRKPKKAKKAPKAKASPRAKAAKPATADAADAAVPPAKRARRPLSKKAAAAAAAEAPAAAVAFIEDAAEGAAGGGGGGGGEEAAEVDMDAPDAAGASKPARKAAGKRKRSVRG